MPPETTLRRDREIRASAVIPHPGPPPPAAASAAVAPAHGAPPAVRIPTDPPPV